MTDYPHILMVTGEYPPDQGGVGDYTALLSSSMQEQGARVTVLTRGDHDLSTEDQPSGKVSVLRVMRGWGFTSWPRMASAVARYRPQIVQIQYQAAAYAMHPAVNLLPIYLRRRAPGIKVVTTFHDLRAPYLFPKAGPLRPASLRMMDSSSAATVATNQADLSALGGAGLGSGGSVKRWLIPIGSNLECTPPADFDRSQWRRQIGATTDTLIVSYFGFMNDSKGVEFLIQALEILAGRGLDWRLLIVGGETGQSDPTNRSYSDRILQLIKSRRLEERVYWTGFVAGEQVSAALLSSDLCALPFRDGASLRRGSLLAALTHGLPVVTTFPEQPDPLLVDGENVALTERDSPSALADAIEQMWLDPDARGRIALGARTLSRQFQWSDIAGRHLELYKTLLSSER